MTTYISNPLPDALRHYEHELVQTLERLGLPALSRTTLAVENQPGVLGALNKLRNALANARQKDQIGSQVIQCWPSLGLLEPRLWYRRTTANLVIFHDPVPIRRQVGFDPISRRLASKFASRHAPTILVHSDDAGFEAKRLFPGLSVRKALHPILSNVQVPSTSGGDILVAGQFKPERNLPLLAELGPMLRRKNLRPRILGRGWPKDIPGWEIESRFLEEHELDAAIDEAAVVLIPYRNYFQSGIAIRALERATLSVSPENSFARDVFGSLPETIYHEDAGAGQVLEHLLTVASSSIGPSGIFSDYRRRVDSSWSELLTEDSKINLN